jgi:hypothetical protein
LNPLVSRGHLRPARLGVTRMKTKLSIGWFVALVLISPILALHGATIATDKTDYHPGTTAIISGTGFKPLENVQLQVLHADGRDDNDPDHDAWEVAADSFGRIEAFWDVCSDVNDCVGQTFVVNAVGLVSGATASATFTDSMPNDFHQAANADAGYGLGNVHWINSILQQNNSKYAEGASTLQRFIVSSLPTTANNVHTFKFGHQANKGTTTHAYDYLTSWSQGVTAANQLVPGSFTSMNTCGDDISLSAVCSGLHATGFTMVVNAPDNMGTNIGDNIEASIAKYEARFGNRTVQIYGDKPITGASLSFDGYTGSGDLFANYTMTWTSSASAVIIEMGGHISAGRDSFRAGIGYGDGRGASSINGGPYHFKLDSVDNITLGSQDNQLKASDVFIVPDCVASNDGPACVGGTVNLGTRSVSNATYAWTGPNGFTSSIQSPVISNITSSAAGTYTVAVTLDSIVSRCTTVVQVSPKLTFSIVSNNVSCASSSNGTVSVNMLTGTAPFTFLWSNGATNQNLTGLSPGNYLFSVIDANGCSATGGVTLVVADTEPPVLSGVPADTTVQCDAIPGPATPTATDRFDPNPIVTLVQSTNSGACAGNKTITRTWTATDACGNASTKTQTITVVDTTAPVLSNVPADMTVQCNAVPSAGTPTAIDNCDSSPAISMVETNLGGTCSGNYTILRTWTATDSCGNKSSATQRVSVINTQLPVLHGVPADVTTACTSVPGPMTVTATGSCGASATVELKETRTPLSCPGVTMLIRTWTATDACGNSASASQHISITDPNPPTLFGCPADMTISCYADLPPAAIVTATNTCGGNAQVFYTETQSDPGASCSNLVTRTWVAANVCGVTNSCTQHILVNDDIAPIVTSAPADATIGCLDRAAYGSCTFSDNCDTNLNVTWADTQSVSHFGQYIYTRTWTATDKCGNVTRVSQTITQNGCDGICVLKFDDVNANGILDPTEQGIEGWQIILTGAWGSLTNYTDATGLVCFSNLVEGTYTVSEGRSLSSTWMAMTPTSYTVTPNDYSQQIVFGNLCLGPGGGLTKGFWQNKNGQAVMTAGGMDGALTMLRNLNLRNYDGSDFDPKTYAAFQSWIKSASSKNAACMLSAQLAAMELNVRAGFVDPTRLVYAPGVGNTGVGNNFITIADLMSAANTSCGLHGYTVDTNADRAYQTALESVIDAANNDRNFVQLKPCKTSFQ